MLDEKDLQAIQGLLEHSESRMMARMDQLDARMDRLDARMDQLDTRIDRLDTRIDRLDARIDQLDARIDQLDTRVGQLGGRIDQLDSRMDRLDTRVDQLGEDIRATESRMMAYIESDVLPRFDILAEGHTLLRETLAPKSRVEELEEEIAFLKPLVMSMLTDIDKLKKAQ